MLGGFRIRAELAARRITRSIVGIVFILIGAAFLGVAGWISLAERYDPLTAALVFGGVFLALGALMLLWARLARVHIPVDGAPDAVATTRPYGGAVPPLLEAFMVGLSAGAASRAGRRRD